MRSKWVLHALHSQMGKDEHNAPDIMLHINLYPVQFKELFMQYLERMGYEYKQDGPLNHEMRYILGARSESFMQNIGSSTPKHMEDGVLIFSHIMRTKQLNMASGASSAELNQGNWIEPAMVQFWEGIFRTQDVRMYVSGRRNVCEAFADGKSMHHQPHTTMYRVGVIAQIRGALDMALSSVIGSDFFWYE